MDLVGYGCLDLTTWYFERVDWEIFEAMSGILFPQQQLVLQILSVLPKIAR
jgi:hypothetical protein